MLDILSISCTLTASALAVRAGVANGVQVIWGEALSRTCIFLDLYPVTVFDLSFRRFGWQILLGPSGCIVSLLVELCAVVPQLGGRTGGFHAKGGVINEGE